MVNLYNNAKYRSFIEERDRALEKILLNARLDISRLLNQALQRALEIILYRHTTHVGIIADSSDITRIVDQHLSQVFKEFAYKIYLRTLRLRRSSFLLSASANFEAVSRITSNEKPLHLDSSQLDDVAASKTTEDEELFHRVQISLNRIKRDLLDALELGMLYEESQVELLDRLKKAMPKAMVNKKPKRSLKPPTAFKEADKKPSVDAAIEFIDPEDWESMIEDYKETELPPMRFFNEPIDIKVGEKDITYAWEYEQYVTHDFVDKVRAGEIEAANKAGIKDFVWIAVVDSHTDECCTVRDGHTSQEIEELMKAGKIDKKECDAIVAPAHFNCRCRMAPIGNESPTKQEFDYKGFDEWLNS